MIVSNCITLCLCFRIYDASKVKQACDGVDIAIALLGTGRQIEQSNPLIVLYIAMCFNI